MRGKSHKKERSPTITIGLYPDLPREKMVRQGNISGEGPDRFSCPTARGWRRKKSPAALPTSR